MRVSQWIDEVRHDVTFALRQSRQAPAFTVIAATTLALGRARTARFSRWSTPPCSGRSRFTIRTAS